MWRPARLPISPPKTSDSTSDGGALEAVEHRLVVVDHLLDHRGQHRGRAERQVLVVPLELVAQGAEGAGLPVTHADGEVVADQHRHLAELHLLERRVVVGGPQHQDRGVVLHRQHRALVGLEDLLDRRLLDAEALEGVGQLLGGRDPQAQPHEGVGLEADPATLLDAEGAGDPLAVPVRRAVDDHREDVTGRSPTRPGPVATPAGTSPEI